MIELRSDTFTLPTAQMKQAMIEAELGDDVWGEDPTVNQLEARVARLLGKEAAVFTCSATQANQIAVKIHCSPGDEILINSLGHIGIYEAGGPAALSGVSVRHIEAPKGMLRLEDLKGKPWPDDPHFTRTRLLCLENTTNIGGGYAYPLNLLDQLGDWANSEGLKVHLDGARLFNATVAAGYTPAQAASKVDTVSICFSKGLACPMGAVLAGSSEDIYLARRVRKMLGGALRQSGMLAGAALYALDHHVDRLKEDHDNAKVFAEGLSKIRGISVNAEEIETNIVFFDVDPDIGTANDLERDLLIHGVKISSMGGQRLRAVTHIDVSADDIPIAIEAVRKSLSQG